MSAIVDLNAHRKHDDAYGDVLASDSVVRSYLRPIKRYMLEHAATEIWINKPGELIIRLETGNITVSEPTLTFAALENFARAVAVFSPQQQTVGISAPLLSATMPDGERIQIVLPPAVEPGLVSMSIRIPHSEIIPIATYRDSGAFSKYIWARPKDLATRLSDLAPDDRVLCELLASNNLHDFIIQSVLARKNIGVIGNTGSGKNHADEKHVPAHSSSRAIDHRRGCARTDAPASSQPCAFAVLQNRTGRCDGHAC